MDKSIWLNTIFTEDYLPLWSCPHCQNGNLKLAKAKFHFEETEDTKKESKNDFWIPEFNKYYFSGLLQCSFCNELVAFLGDGILESYDYTEQITEEIATGYIQKFTPIYFYPAIPLFKISSFCPKEIKEEINKSFALYWSDLEACANRIRTSVEAIMNQQGVKKCFLKNRKREYYNLHRRIEFFQPKRTDVADLLLAIKWIGNTGSHFGKLERGDVLDAYELLEHSINKLYDKSDIKLKRLSKNINKRKGVRRRRSPF